MLNNNIIALASTKEYILEYLEYSFRKYSESLFPFLVTAGEQDEGDEDEEEENENGVFQSSFICQWNTFACLQGQFIA